MPAPPGDVWARVTTPAGVNDELWPVMRMTVPPAWGGRPLASMPSGTHLGRSWVLLFGVVPFDYDDLTLAVVEDGHFVEQSTMLSMAAWRHERTVVATDGGARVTDVITFTPRLPMRWADRLLGLGLERFFRHRHRRLARWVRRR